MRASPSTTPQSRVMGLPALGATRCRVAARSCSSPAAVSGEMRAAVLLALLRGVAARGALLGDRPAPTGSRRAADCGGGGIDVMRREEGRRRAGKAGSSPTAPKSSSPPPLRLRFIRAIAPVLRHWTSGRWRPTLISIGVPGATRLLEQFDGTLEQTSADGVHASDAKGSLMAAAQASGLAANHVSTSITGLSCSPSRQASR